MERSRSGRMPVEIDRRAGGHLMKTSLRKIALMVAAIVLIAALTPQSASADVSFSFFYSNLSPHGSWLVSADYGRVWRPGIYHRGWNPYYDGHWVYTEFGWTW